MGIDSCIDKNNAAYRVLAIDRAMPQRAGLEVTDYDAYNLNHFFVLRLEVGTKLADFVWL